MKYIYIFVIITLATLVWAGTDRPDMQNDGPLYADDQIKIQLSPDAIKLLELPGRAYEQALSFGLNELDQLMVVTGGITITRAHIQAKDLDWQAKTGFDRWFLIALNGKMSVEEALKLWQSNRFVDLATPEYLAYTTAIPDDPLFTGNWGHQNTGQLLAWNPPSSSSGSHSGSPVGLAGFDTSAPLAWNNAQAYGSQTIIVAVIDSGVDLGHPDLMLVPGYDYGDNDADPSPNPTSAVINAHGTAVSGIVAGSANNNLGVAGIAGNVKIMPIKAMDNTGTIQFTNVANAVIHAADNGADVINLSLGSFTNPGVIPAMDAALDYAFTNMGLPIFASSGNSNTSTIQYPANHINVIAVGAAAPDGQRKSTSSADGEYWWGSNYGVATRDAANAIDIMGPTILPTTDITGSAGYSNTDYDLWFNGTSCASPYVAGVAALLLSKDNSLSPAQIRQALTSSARDMTIGALLGWDRFTGYGMVNAHAAIMAISAPPQITWSPASITMNLTPGASASTSMQLGNTGEQDLAYILSGNPIISNVLSESFESGGSYPAGWTSTVNSGIQHWIFSAGGAGGTNPAGSYSGALNALLWQSGSTPSSTRLASPVINLSAASSATLSFYHTQPYRFGQDLLIVQYRNSAAGAWTNLVSYTQSVVDWTRHTIALPQLSAEYQIAFLGITNQGWGVGVDMVTIDAVTGYEVPWLKVEGDFSLSGSISGGDNATLAVQIDAGSLNTGTYSSSLLLQSNSSLNPNILIPVQLNVGTGTLALDPPQLTISLLGNNVLLQWTAVENANDYRIFKSSDPHSGFVEIAVTANLQYSEPASPEGAFYRVSARNP